jgi:hypothetical protein
MLEAGILVLAIAAWCGAFVWRAERLDGRLRSSGQLYRGSSLRQEAMIRQAPWVRRIAIVSLAIGVILLVSSALIAWA